MSSSSSVTSAFASEASGQATARRGLSTDGLSGTSSGLHVKTDEAVIALGAKADVKLTRVGPR